MKGKNSEFDRTAVESIDAFNDYEQRLAELALAMFKWTGLPDTIDARFMELVLFGQGKVLFFKDDVVDEFFCLRCHASGPFDIYNIPIYRTAYAANGYNNTLDNTNSVIIWNNMLHTNTYPAIRRKAKMLQNFDAIIDVNVRAQRTPVLIACDENELLTMKQIYQKYDGNQPVIYGTSKISPNDIKCFNTGAPLVADKLYQLKMEYWNEALTVLGINNASVVKKERVVTAEVKKGQGGIEANRLSRLKARQYACTEINRMFGLEIWCDFEDSNINLAPNMEANEDNLGEESENE